MPYPTLPLAIVGKGEDQFFFMLMACCEASLHRSSPSVGFNPDLLSDYGFERFCRFKRPEFRRVLHDLQFPDKITLQSRHTVTGEECLLLLLRRLTYPVRFCDLAQTFGRSESPLSIIFNHALDHVYEKTKHLLEFDWERLTPAYLERMCALVRRKGSPLVNCVGFIDGTVRPICRPGRNQRDYYNGHKRTHALKYHSITFPDGIVVFSDGPYAGRRHDSGMLHESGLPQILERNLRGVDGRQLQIYGDAAYPYRDYIVSPYKGSQLSAEQQEFNCRMASVRIAVEVMHIQQDRGRFRAL